MTDDGRSAERASRRLLVVDASEASRRLVGDYFRARGYEVTTAGDGLAALTATALHPVDVVVMNVALPRLEGYETAALLRKAHPRLEIILTAGSDAETRPRKSRRVDRFRCFPQPLDLDGLAAAIERRAGSGRPGDAPEDRR